MLPAMMKVEEVEFGTRQENSIFQSHRFKEGEVVYERTHPSQKLIISHYADKLYYCKVLEAPERKALVYFERELQPESSLIHHRD